VSLGVPPNSLLTGRPLPYPKIVVCGFGAAGKAGKASSLDAAVGFLALGAGLFDAEAVPPIQDGLGCCGCCCPGRAGNADAGAIGRDDAPALGFELAEDPEARDMTDCPPTLVRRVLFLSLSTRVEWRS
jgi:hypothetical protein